MARSNERHVGKLLERFDFDAFGAVGGKKQAYVALRAFQAGVGVSANLLYGWDTCRKRSAPDAKNGGALP